LEKEDDMSDRRAAVLEVMESRIRRDMERGGTGHLSTAEVAEQAGLTTAQARRVLEELSVDGIVDGFDGSSDSSSRPSYDWRLAGYDWDPESGNVIRIDDGEVKP
jgi:predicted ArsR family transcriptional regulator